MSYLILAAWMLGVSNVILEETRMVHESRVVIEEPEIIPDTDLDAEEVYKINYSVPLTSPISTPINKSL